MKKLLLIAIVFSFIAPVSLNAETKGKPSYKRMRYGMSGCGVGSLFIEKNTMLPQIGSWIVNMYTGSQTSAITSGTSNCTDKPHNEAKLEQEVFVRVNLAKLSKEAAQGSGEHLAALAEVLGCEEGSFARLSQDKYTDLYGAHDANAVLSSYAKEINEHPELSKGCSRIIG